MDSYLSNRHCEICVKDAEPKQLGFDFVIQLYYPNCSVFVLVSIVKTATAGTVKSIGIETDTLISAGLEADRQRFRRLKSVTERLSSTQGFVFLIKLFRVNSRFFKSLRAVPSRFSSRDYHAYFRYT